MGIIKIKVANHCVDTRLRVNRTFEPARNRHKEALDDLPQEYLAQLDPNILFPPPSTSRRTSLLSHTTSAHDGHVNEVAATGTNTAGHANDGGASSLAATTNVFRHDDEADEHHDINASVK